MLSVAVLIGFLNKAVARAIEEWLPSVKGVVDVVNRSVVIGPSVNFRVDPQKAARLGFAVSDMAAVEAAEST